MANKTTAKNDVQSVFVLILQPEDTMITIQETQADSGFISKYKP